MLLLSNLIFIHYSNKDFRKLSAFEELIEIVKEIRTHDENIKICILLRDTRETKHVDPEDYPKEFKKIEKYIDALIEVKDMK